MKQTTIQALAIGENGTRSFTFLVDTRSTFVGLPLEDIKTLGLPMIHGGRYKITTDAGIVERETYVASIQLDPDIAPAIVLESPVPTIGWGVLENLRMKVNPVTRELEKAPPDEHMPPYVRTSI